MEIDTLKTIYHVIGAIMFSIIMSLLRVLADSTETSWERIALESLLCGGITATFISLILFLGWNVSICGFIAGMVGLVGSVFIRSIARKIIVKKADVQ
jgi:lambda family phage holin